MWVDLKKSVLISDDKAFPILPRTCRWLERVHLSLARRRGEIFID